MINRRTVAVLAAIGAIAAANLVTACVKSDDQDFYATPTPPPPPPPPSSQNCQIVWTSQNASDPTAIDAFILDSSKTTFVNGNATIGTTITGVYQAGLSWDPTTMFDLQPAVTDTTGAVLMTTSGEITISGITLNGVAPGEPIIVDSNGPQPLMTVDTTLSPTSTQAGTVTFHFDGTWSSAAAPLDGLVTDTTGSFATVTIGTMGTETLGSYGSFAVCYDL